MNRLDPRLRQLVHADSLARSSMMERLGLSLESHPNVNVLIRCRDTAAVAELRQAGAEVRVVIEGVYTTVTANVPIELLRPVSEIEGVHRGVTPSFWISR